jgi:hypothetical protein
MPGRPLRLFYSYAHEDEELRDELEKRLSTLRANEAIEEWHDRRILAGESWGDEIDAALDRADIILLLLSPDFLGSTYIRDVEVQRALTRHQRQEAVVVPIVLRPVPLGDTPFRGLQALPKDARPITLWENADQAFLDVYEGLAAIVAARAEAAAAPAPEAAAPAQPSAEPTAEYADLAVEIGMDAVSFQVDDQVFRGSPDFSPETLARLDGLRDGDPDAYGSALFDAVFRADPSLREGYGRARARIRRRWARFRMRLHIDPDADALKALWWEALRDQQPPPRRLATQHGTPLSRFLDGADPEPVGGARVKVLVVVANPSGLGPPGLPQLADYDADAELAVVERALSPLDDRADYHVHREAASAQRVRDRLLEERFDVLHLVAPGIDGEGDAPRLLLEEEPGGGPDPLSAEVVGAIVGSLDELRLVVLSTGYTSAGSSPEAHLDIAGQLLEYGVPAVLATRGRMAAESAAIFTEAFYNTLLRSPQSSGLVDVAANHAREAVWFRRRNGWEWAAPVVFLGGAGRIYDAEPQGPADPGPGVFAPAAAIAGQPVVPAVMPAQAALPGQDTAAQRRLEAFHLLTAKYGLTAEEMDRIAAPLGRPLESAAADVEARARELVGAYDDMGRIEMLIQQVLLVVAQRESRPVRDPAFRALDSLMA